MERNPASNQSPSQAFFSCGFTKVGSQRVKYIVDWKIAYRGTNNSGFELIDIEEAVQHIGHGLQRVADADNRLARLAVANLLRQCRLQYFHGLQWLTQIMARRGGESGIGAGGLLGHSSRRRPFPLRLPVVF